jgi:hypothetical protein
MHSTLSLPESTAAPISVSRAIPWYRIWNVLTVVYATQNQWVSGHWRMPSSGTLHRVALVRTDVSEIPSASFIRVTRIGELGATLAVTSNRRTLRRNTKVHRFLSPWWKSR